jgi:hypothetical protein
VCVCVYVRAVCHVSFRVLSWRQYNPVSLLSFPSFPKSLAVFSPHKPVSVLYCQIKTTNGRSRRRRRSTSLKDGSKRHKTGRRKHQTSVSKANGCVLKSKRTSCHVVIERHLEHHGSPAFASNRPGPAIGTPEVLACLGGKSQATTTTTILSSHFSHIPISFPLFFASLNPISFTRSLAPRAYPAPASTIHAHTRLASTSHTQPSLRQPSVTRRTNSHHNQTLGNSSASPRHATSLVD